MNIKYSADIVKAVLKYRNLENQRRFTSVVPSLSFNEIMWHFHQVLCMGAVSNNQSYTFRMSETVRQYCTAMVITIVFCFLLLKCLLLPQCPSSLRYKPIFYPHFDIPSRIVSVPGHSKIEVVTLILLFLM